MMFNKSNWNADKAYILGFTLADGSLSQDGHQILWTQVESNNNILEFIKSVLSIDSDIVTKPQHGNFDGQNISYLHYRNKDIHHELCMLGLVPGKTYHKLPVFDKAYEYGCFRDFVRGYFDGDGCASVYKAKSKNRPNAPDGLRVFFVCKMRENLVSLGGILKDEINIVPKIYPLEGSFRLQYGTREALRLYDYIYHNSKSYHLPCKKSTFDNYMQYRGIYDNYATTCDNCGIRFVRMNPGEKVCHKCRHTEYKNSAQYRYRSNKGT